MEEKIAVRNKLIILRTHHRQVMNLIKLGRFQEAIAHNKKFGAILTVWKKEATRKHKCKFD